jgi:hypothetical protein
LDHRFIDQLQRLHDGLGAAESDLPDFPARRQGDDASVLDRNRLKAERRQ